MSEPERLVSDAIGRLMELWGFKRNMGRVWAVLYLSEVPLPAAELRARLGLSSGAVSMILAELGRWGVVSKAWVPGDRRDHYSAEANVWKMVSRVVREREQAEIGQAIEALERALSMLKSRNTEQFQMQKARIENLLELAKLGRAMLDALVSSARLDARWLPRFRLGRSA